MTALDHAHRRGIVHRDIKPENILLHDGRALAADFGIALAASSAGSRMTETGMSLGTPHDMSPEQAMGERTLDARTDVHARRCVRYEMLVAYQSTDGSRVMVTTFPTQDGGIIPVQGPEQTGPGYFRVIPDGVAMMQRAVDAAEHSAPTPRRWTGGITAALP